VHADSDKFPAIVDARNELAYIRLMRSEAQRPTGYPPDVLAQWAQGARDWTAQASTREAFIFFINGAKERAPAAAQALIQLVS
jgi:uncharacterized protein YecE (DUF72 family)